MERIKRIIATAVVGDLLGLCRNTPLNPLKRGVWENWKTVPVPRFHEDKFYGNDRIWGEL